MKTIEEVKAELHNMANRNRPVWDLLKQERGYKHMAESCAEAGNKKDAEQWADMALALKVGEKQVTIKDLCAYYTPVFMRLDELDRSIAFAVFVQGMTYKQAARCTYLSAETINKRVNGRNDPNRKYYRSIYEKVLEIIKEDG